ATDTYLRLYNGSNTQVAYNDDACSVQSTIVFPVTATGTYIVKAGCYSSGTCDGVVSITSAVTPPSDPITYEEAVPVRDLPAY
ncbi:hypothetical protein KJ865_04520, partial [Myxococcota bacterium]|nr:hypothetical protein [Myxococcota bacterium]